MACQLNLLAKFEDISSIRRYLYPNLKEETKKVEEFEGWDNSDWGWQDDDEVHKAQHAASGTADVTWLHDCHLSLSPAADLMAVGKGDRLVLLAQKWDPAEEEVSMKFHTVFEGVVRQEEGETVTAVFCLPLASQKRSTQGGPDWTCVLAGFSSGYVRMYTETGTLLLSQIFSEVPVRSIKCRTYEPPRHAADAEKHEELNILYQKALITIDGFSFFQSLRACRNQVARAAASGSDMIQPPPLTYKKWALQDQSHVQDHTPAGVVTPNPFDQMVNASMLGGFTANIRPTPPVAHVYVAAGKNPYVAYYFAQDGSAQPILADVAHAVATKLKSALFSQISAASGWLGFGGKHGQDPTEKRKRPKIEPATSLVARFGLPDKRRDGETVKISPDNRLAATTDSFGRVILIDMVRGCAVRMWKGYRDAQVGWLEVHADPSLEAQQQQQPPSPNYPMRSHQPPPPPRRAFFLVIYAPRRGILEVWTCQQGPRVAAFNVSKQCHLLTPDYGMMGLNNVTYREVKVALNHLYLLDPDGTVKVIDVPFHLALSDKNSKRARDMHLLKKLMLTLKETTAESGALQQEVIDTLTDIKIANIRQQGVERVLHTKYLSVCFLQTVLRAVTLQLETQGELRATEAGDDKKPDDDAEEGEGEGGDQQGMDYESRVLLQGCQAQQLLLGTYSKLVRCNAEEQDEAMEVDQSNEQLCNTLGLSSDELQTMEVDIHSYQDTLAEKKTTKVKFQVDGGGSTTTMSVTDFLSCFECQIHSSSSSSEKSAPIMVCLCQGLTDSRKMRLANFMYTTPLQHGLSSDFTFLLKESHVNADDLLSLLMTLWLSDDKRSLSSTVNLQLLIKSISALKEPSAVVVEANEVSTWWQSLRNTCAAATHLSASVMAAIACRSVVTSVTTAMLPNTDTISLNSNESIDDWESVCVDKEQWSLLIKQLEDLLVLQALLNMRDPSKDPITLSVKKVLDGGRGVVPEYVAKWIASEGVLPSMLCLNQQQDLDEIESSPPTPSASATSVASAAASKLKRADSSISPVVAQLQLCQQRLPHSLDSDVLMANCAWEYAVLWNKDPEVIFALDQALAFLKCIQNALLQHGVASMMWQMFIVKKLSAAAMLMDKVGKAPKDRLCRRDVGLSEQSTEKFVGICVDLLDTMMQTFHLGASGGGSRGGAPLLVVEDLWAGGVNASSSAGGGLAELALEQKESNVELVEHHYYLTVIMHAILTFSMKQCKPLGLFDTKGKNALFKPLHTSPILPSRIVDETILEERAEFMKRVIGQAVLCLGEAGSPTISPSSSPPRCSSPPRPPRLQRASTSSNSSSMSVDSPSRIRKLKYSQWPPLMLRLAKDLAVDMDLLRRHHVLNLYAGGHDKLAEEVLLTVNDHTLMGMQLILIAGQRLHHFIFTCDLPNSVEKLAKCSTKLSGWLKTACTEHLRCPNPPLVDTAALIGRVVNELPEGHSEYTLALELVELVHAFM